MKNFKKIMSMAFVAVLATTTVFSAGCGREEVNPGFVEDETKSTLLISNYQGGFGRVWLDKCVERFIEKYKDTSFEPDKKGVQVRITSSINDTAGDNFLAGVKNNPNHVIITESTPYYTVVGDQLAADITDIVTQPLTEFGETESIVDKLNPTLKEFHNVSDKYYAMPHYEDFKHIIYDVDLFDVKGLWMAEGGGYGSKENITLTKGLDGVSGTDDDGLPTTYDEFFALCDHMVKKGVIPFSWAGGNPGYATNALYGFWADYEGKDGIMLNYTFDGTATTLVNSMSGDGELNANGGYDDMRGATTITLDNKKELQRQAGRYAALNFAKRITSNVNYATARSYSSAQSNLTAQGDYLLSRLESTKTPIAFLFEGTFWENEADENGKFREYEAYGETRATRKFAVMPTPKASASKVGEKRTYTTNCLYSLTFINGNIKDENILKLAKKFYQFMHTDNELQEFSVNTGTCKALEYEIPAEKMANMSYYGRSVLSLRNNPNVEMVYTFSKSNYFINHMSEFWSYEMLVGSGEHPLMTFHDTPSKTVKDYFTSLTK